MRQNNAQFDQQTKLHICHFIEIRPLKTNFVHNGSSGHRYFCIRALIIIQSGHFKDCLRWFLVWGRGINGVTLCVVSQLIP